MLNKTIRLNYFLIIKFFIKACNCNKNGTDNNCQSNCDLVTGNCKCLPNVIGRKCDQCLPGYWNIDSAQGCLIPCECDPTGTVEKSVCDQYIGKCHCLSNRSGRKCDECPDGMYGNPESGCLSNN